jgi:hypothetical protein
MKNPVHVYHDYSLNTTGKSAWGRVKMIEEALEPLKSLHDYGFEDDLARQTVKIWWRELTEL